MPMENTLKMRGGNHVKCAIILCALSLFYSVVILAAIWGAPTIAPLSELLKYCGHCSLLFRNATFLVYIF